MLVNVIYLLVTILALGGIVVSYMVRRAKRKGETIYCPMDSDCHKVINSRYARLLKIHNETLGLIFYSLTFLATIILFFFFSEINDLTQIFAAITGAAFLFSVYLAWLQAVKLKEWCTLCLLSGIFSTAVFFSLLSILV